MNNFESYKLTDIDFWKDGYSSQTDFFAEKISHPVVNNIYRYFGKETFKNKSVFEIGCYSGRFLYHFGKNDFILNGIDYVDKLSKMVEWFKENNFKLGEFIKDDLFNLKLEKKYDVVFSSGFIEHFKNFEDIIRIHAKLVEKDGYVLITVPNFAGWVQKFLHTIFDKKNLGFHYLPSMNPTIWKDVLEREGFEVLEYGYIGGFNFWSANTNIISRVFVKIIRVLFCWDFLPNARAYSPDIFILAKNK